jgi:uncharacterized lipoprotein YddW (UPF0748 family)
MKNTAVVLLLAGLLGLAVLPSPAAPAGAGGPSSRIRGVWLSPAQFGTDKAAATARLASTLADYRRAGIDTLMVLVKTTSGYVYYPSRIAPMDPAWDWDFMADLVREAGREGLTVHAWFCVFPEEALVGQVRAHPEWLIENRAGELHPALNPADPDARRYELGLMQEFLDLYPSVSWVHLDYIRYPCDPEESYYSYDPATRKLFQGLAGQDPATVKNQDSGNPLWNRWIEWNALQVTAFVRELRAALALRARPVRISAAVFPDAVNAKVLIGQDWASWAEQGLVDMLCPMLYTNDTAYFEELVRRAVAAGRGRCLVCPGIGLRTSHNEITPEGLRAEIELSFARGADGVVFFSGSSLRPELLERID